MGGGTSGAETARCSFTLVIRQVCCHYQGAGSVLICSCKSGDVTPCVQKYTTFPFIRRENLGMTRSGHLGVYSNHTISDLNC